MGGGGGPVVHSRVVQKFNFGETKTRKLLILSKGLLGNRIFILVIVLLFFFLIVRKSLHLLVVCVLLYPNK